VYSLLTETEARDYRQLKTALLRKYQLTIEGFRKHFYSARLEREETALQFVCRIEGYLDRWIQLAEIEESFKGLKDLIVREQFLAVCEEHLAIYLRERDPRKISDMVKLADTFLDARLHRDGKDKKGKMFTIPKPVHVDMRENGKSSADVVYDCNKKGEGKSGPVCYLCKQVGYVRKNCRHNRQDSKGNTRTENLAGCQEFAEGGCNHALMTPGNLELRCGCQLPYVECLSENSLAADCRLPTVTGRVNGENVSVLRDTGRTTVVIW